MTQVKEWSNQELNRKLADLMGWTVSGQFYVNSAGEHVHVVVNWHPCTDPAASLEVQTKAIEVDAPGYMRNLAKVRWGDAVDWEDVDYWSGINIVDCADLFIATPRERAEAAYMTLREVKQHVD